MRTVKELLKNKGKVTIFCSSEEIARLFLRNAKAEGFMIGGEDPEGKEPSDLFTLGRDFSVSYPGYAGHLAFRTKGWRSPVPVTYIDYGKYVTGQKRYVIRKVRASIRCLWARKDTACFRKGFPV